MRALESTFSMDSACGLESAIASSRGVDRPQVLSSLRDSQSPDSSSTILESKSVDKNHATNKKVDSSPNAPTPSLRGDEIAEAIHTKQADSSSKVDCHDLPSKSRNDKNLDSSGNALSQSLRTDNALFPSLRDFALAKSWQSTPPKTQTLESTFDKTAQNSPSLSSRDFRKEVVAIHSKKVDSRETAQLNHHDSRICGVASGAFCGFWGRARLEVCGYPKIHKIAAMNTQSRIA